MKTSSKAIYIVGALLIVTVIALVICGGLLFLKTDEGEATNEEPYAADLDDSGKIGDKMTISDSDPSTILAFRARAQSSQRLYFRYKSFGDYTGQRWMDASSYGRVFGDGYGMNHLAGAAMRASGYPVQKVEIELLGTQYLLPYYLFDGGEGYEIQKNDVTQKGVTRDRYSVDYAVYNGGEIFPHEEHADAEERYREFVKENYCALPADTMAALRKILAEEGFTAKDKYIVEKVAEYVQGCAEYSLEYDRALDGEEDIAVAFLTKYKQGICQHFASAAVLLYRALGIPARYVIGYVGDLREGTWTDVKADRAHAWAEVYRDGVGWIQVEVTGGSALPDPPQEEYLEIDFHDPEKKADPGSLPDPIYAREGARVALPACPSSGGFALVGWTRDTSLDTYIVSSQEELQALLQCAEGGIISVGGGYFVQAAHALEGRIGFCAVWAADRDEDDTPDFAEANPETSFSKSESPHIPVLTVTSELSTSMYLRESSYGDYTFRGFAAGESYSSLLYGTYCYNYLTGAALAGAENSRLYAATIDPLGGFALPYYPAMTDGDGYPVPLSDVSYPSGVTAPYTVYFRSYKYGTDELPAVPSVLTAEEREYREFVQKHYLSLPESTKRGLNEILMREGIFPDDPDIIGKIGTFVRGAARYDMNYDTRLDEEEDVVLAFLNEYRAGICQHFAAAATLLYRAAGIPARYVTGYVGAVERDRETIIYADQAHAWTEIYIAGSGWIKVDAVGDGTGMGAADPDFPLPPYGEEGEYTVILENMTEGVLSGDVVLPFRYEHLREGQTVGLPKELSLYSAEGNYRLLGWSFYPYGIVSSEEEIYDPLYTDSYTVRWEDADFELCATLYAVWVPDYSGERYTLRFENACGVFAGLPGERTGLAEGALEELPHLPAGEQTIFLGWSLQKSEEVLRNTPSFNVFDLYFVSRADADGNNTILFYAVWGEDVNGDGVPDWDERHDIRFVDPLGGKTENFPDDLIGYLGDSYRLAGAEEPVTCLFGGQEYALYGWTREQGLESYIVGDDPFPYGYYSVGERVYNTEDATYYAIWQKVEARYTVVTVNTAEGEVFPVDDLETKYPDIPEGRTLLLPGSERTYHLEGEPRCVLLGWTAVPSGGIAGEEPEATYTPVSERYTVRGADAREGVITLYALWAPDVNGNGVPDWRDARFRIEFADDAAAGSMLPSPIEELLEGMKQPLPEAEAGRENVLFCGWTVEQAPEVYREMPSFAWSIEYIVRAEDADENKTIVLHAVWAEDANGDGIPDWDQRHNIRFVNTLEGETTGFPEDLPDYLEAFLVLPGTEEIVCTSEGVEYRLAGWTKVSSLKSYIHERTEAYPAGFEKAGTTVPAADAVYYAVWEEAIVLYTVRTVNEAAGEVISTEGAAEDGLAGVCSGLWEGYSFRFPTGYFLYDDGTYYALLGWTRTAGVGIQTSALAGGFELSPDPYLVNGGDADENNEIVFYAVWAVDRNGNHVPDWEDPVYTYRFTNATSAVSATLPAPLELLAGIREDLTQARYLPQYQAEGFVFYGWTQERTSRVFAEPACKMVRYTTDATAEGDTVLLYAVWAEDRNGNGIADCDDERCTLVYRHKLGQDIIGWPAEVRDILVNTSVILAGLDQGGNPYFTLTVNGISYTLAGWTQQVYDDGSVYLTEEDALYLFGDFAAAGTPFSVTKNTVLYAVWVANNAQGGGQGGQGGQGGGEGGEGGSEQGGGQGGQGGGGQGGGLQGSGGIGDLDDSGSIGGGANGDEVVMRLTSDHSGTVYLRYKSFGDYNGKSWDAAVAYPELIGGQYSANYLAGAALADNGYTAYTLTVERAQTSQSHSAQYYLPAYLPLVGGEYNVQTSDVVYSGGTGGYTVPYYTYSVAQGTPAGKQYRAFEAAYREFVYDHYLTVRESTAEGLWPLLKANGLYAGDPDLLRKVALYVSGAATYSLQYDRSLDSAADVVLSFLTEYKAGICSHYASAATVIFRMLGIPARYTVGYVGKTEAGKTTEVKQSAAHAWVEVYLDGFGWAKVEVTGSATGSGSGSGGGSGGAVSDFGSDRLDGQKENAKQELEDYGDEKKQEVDKDGSLTDGQKDAIKDAIDQAVEEGKEKIDDASSDEEVKGGLADGKGAVDGVTDSKGDLDTQKENAKKELEDYGEEKKQEIEEDDRFTDREKEDLKQQIDDAVESGKGAIGGASSGGEVQGGLSDGKGAVDGVSGGAQLGKDKEEAKKELEDYGEEKKKEVDKDGSLSEEQKQAIKDAIDDAVENGKEAIGGATSGEGVQGGLADGKKAVDGIADSKGDLDTQKENAKKELEDYGEEKKQEIDGDDRFTDEEKQAIKDAMDGVVESGKEAIGGASSGGDVSGDLKDGKEKLDDITDGAQFGKDKEDAKKELEDYGEEKKQEIDGDDRFTDQEKEELKQQVDDAVERGKQSLDGASGKDELGGKLEEGKEAVDGVQDGAVLGKQKENAKQELEDYGEAKKQEIDGDGSLSGDQKEAAKDAIGDAVESGKKAIGDASSQEEVERELDKAKDAVDGIADSKGDLDAQKENAKKELEDYGEEKKQEIEADGRFSDAEKEALKQQIDDAVKGGKEEIGDASSGEDVSDSLRESKEKLDDIADSAQLGKDKEEAQKEIEDFGERFKQETEQDSRFSSGERSELKRQIEEAVEDAKEAIGGAASGEDVARELENGKQKVQDLFEGAQLGKDKEDAKQELGDFSERVKEELAENGSFSPEEKEALQKEIDDAVERGKEAIDGAETGGEADEALQNAEREVQKAVEDAQLGKDKEEAKKALGNYGEEKKQETDRRGDLTDDRKQSIKDKIDEATEAGKKAIENAQTEEEVRDAAEQAQREIDAAAKGEKRVLYFTTFGLTVEYDGKYHAGDDRYLFRGELAPGHTLQPLIFPVRIRDVGSVANIPKVVILDASGADVTAEYEIGGEFGLLTVTPRKITVSAKSERKQYDGTPQTCDGYTLGGSLAAGDEITVEIEGTLTKPGRITTRIVKVRIVNEAGEDVTQNYIIETVNGTLTVTN